MGSKVTFELVTMRLFIPIWSKTIKHQLLTYHDAVTGCWLHNLTCFTFVREVKIKISKRWQVKFVKTCEIPEFPTFHVFSKKFLQFHCLIANPFVLTYIGVYCKGILLSYPVFNLGDKMTKVKRFTWDEVFFAENLC